ncbi:MAG: NmrA family NAD(P)-binding protein [Verrucomicrobia bacterium]|nr:NmrA family NAD(P)-binding protein [Verrucomicrobiota bacterium]
MNKSIAVTGAFGYSGSHIARLLLEAGHKVLTLTNSPKPTHPLANQIVVRPFNFDDPKQLVESLRSCGTLINTYWVRFDHKAFDHSTAVKNTLTLLSAAKQAGIERIVHVSITNPEEGSPLPYFHGKGQLERAVRESGIPHSILRPAVLFGDGDILINNIAWALRRLPCFGVFGDGNYKIQPIHVSDFAALAVREAFEAGNRTIEAIGPETFTYRELAETIGRIIGCKRPVFSVPPLLGYAVARTIGWIQQDEFVTREEIAGLMQNRLFVEAPPAGTTRLTEWAKANTNLLGRTYANELSRRTCSDHKDRSMMAVD